MSDLTDNWFYPSAERIWLGIRLNQAGKHSDRSTYRRYRRRICVQMHNWAILFENEKAEAATVNSDRYWAMLNKFLFTKFEEQDISNIWFQQDGTTNVVVHTLEQCWEIGLRSTITRCQLWQKKIIFSDEVYFDLGGHVNKQNCRIWATEYLHAYIEKPTHLQRVTVWRGFWSRGIIFWDIFLRK